MYEYGIFFRRVVEDSIELLVWLYRRLRRLFVVYYEDLPRDVRFAIAFLDESMSGLKPYEFTAIWPEESIAKSFYFGVQSISYWRSGYGASARNDLIHNDASWGDEIPEPIEEVCWTPSVE